MPNYNKSPFAALPQKLILGFSLAYLFGSWNGSTSPTKMQVSNVAITTNVATLTVQIVDGNIPGCRRADSRFRAFRIIPVPST